MKKNGEDLGTKMNAHGRICFHQPSASNYFVERFGGNNLTNQAQIPIFIQGQNPEDHINTCEKEWRRLGYKDKRAWTHLFPSTLSDLPNKWYKMEEARGETFIWQELKENFIKDFRFIPEDTKYSQKKNK